MISGKTLRSEKHRQPGERPEPWADSASTANLDVFRSEKRTARKWNVAIAGASLLVFLVALKVFSAMDVPNILGSQMPENSGAAHTVPPSVHFGSCHIGGGTNCVVDGDTFWMDGVKIRVADIDAPETHPPRCQREADLGNRATNRLQELLNSGPVELHAVDRDEDTYGRKLRIVSRNGQSIGAMLVSEGLARQWGGPRQPWC